METAKIFQNSRQAVRLPKQYRFEGTEVAIRKVGDAVVLTPVHRSWESLFQSLIAFEPEFKIARAQPKAQQKRATFPK